MGNNRAQQLFEIKEKFFLNQTIVLDELIRRVNASNESRYNVGGKDYNIDRVKNALNGIKGALRQHQIVFVKKWAKQKSEQLKENKSTFLINVMEAYKAENNHNEACKEYKFVHCASSERVKDAINVMPDSDFPTTTAEPSILCIHKQSSRSAEPSLNASTVASAPTQEQAQTEEEVAPTTTTPDLTSSSSSTLSPSASSIASTTSYVLTTPIPPSSSVSSIATAPSTLSSASSVDSDSQPSLPFSSSSSSTTTATSVQAEEREEKQIQDQEQGHEREDVATETHISASTTSSSSSSSISAPAQEKDAEHAQKQKQEKIEPTTTTPDLTPSSSGTLSSSESSSETIKEEAINVSPSTTTTYIRSAAGYSVGCILAMFLMNIKVKGIAKMPFCAIIGLGLSIEEVKFGIAQMSFDAVIELGTIVKEKFKSLSFGATYNDNERSYDDLNHDHTYYNVTGGIDKDINQDE